MKKFLALGALVAVALVSNIANAQDASQAGTFGSVTLSAGFTPDPTTVALTAGGGTQVTVPGCTGWVADAPDYEVSYTAGSWPLYVYFIGDGDTTLLINGPDGSWSCADDVSGFNPAVTFDAPMSGTYDIWVGTYTAAAGTTGTLYVSELAPQW